MMNGSVALAVSMAMVWVGMALYASWLLARANRLEAVALESTTDRR